MKRRPPPAWLRAARVQNHSPTDWLSRALARAGVLPTPAAEQAIRAGRVSVNGRVQTQPLAAISKSDTVRLDGAPVSLEADTIAAMLHKPAGVVCARNDPEHIGTVFDVFHRALPPELQRYGWHAVGRLDRNTTGLLLFTNDEKLVAHVTSPESHLPKRYWAKVSGVPTDSKLAPLRSGIVLDDGPTRPADVSILPDGRVELIITEGRNHQVKRMLAAVKLPVLKLHRQAVGQVELDVSESAVRLLSEKELSRGLGFR